MSAVNLTAPAGRTLLPVCFCFARYRAGAWWGCCLYGPDEHVSREAFQTRDAALTAAQHTAAGLLHNDVGGGL